jgi:hypothetical protein
VNDKELLCEKIRSLYPEIGECGIDVDVDWSADKKRWIVDLKKDQHELTTHLEPEEADDCMEGNKCVSLGIQISQLKDNIQKLPG